MPRATKPSAPLYLALALAASQQALAANDWSVPCTQGKCSWDISADTGSSGTMNIWGPTTAISDITPAAGWKITSCNPLAMAQDIMLMCEDENPNCAHLFQGGATNTIVRLPESCGPMPFARVAKHWVVQNNSPSSGSGSANAQVHGLTLDTDFAAVTPSSENDYVHFALQGMNSQGGPNTVAPVRRSSRWHGRSGYDSRHSIYQRQDSTNASTDASASTTPSAAASLGITSFNKTITPKTTPINFSKSGNLFNTTVQCSANSNGSLPISASASVSLDAGANVNAKVGLGAVAAGTVIPPHITQFGLTFALDGTVDANLNIAANVTGTLSSGSIPLFELGIPGLSFPGILDVGPQFKVSAEMDATVELTDIEASVELKYDLSGVGFTFPPQDSSQAGSFTPGTNRAITFSGNPDVGASLGLTGHLIPQLEVGVTALGGKASANVFVNLDAEADLTVSTSTASGAQTCANANTGLGVNVGAQGSFFNLFDSSVQKSLFNATFPLLQNKCFGGSNSNASSSIAAATSTAAVTSATDATSTAGAASATDATSTADATSATDATSTAGATSATDATSTADATSATDVTSTADATSATDATSTADATSATDATSTADATSATDATSTADATSATDATSTADATSATDATSTADATSATDATSTADATSATDATSTADGTATADASATADVTTPTPGVRRRNARPGQAFHARSGGSVLPIYRRQTNLGCPSIPSLAKVALNELV